MTGKRGQTLCASKSNNNNTHEWALMNTRRGCQERKHYRIAQSYNIPFDCRMSNRNIDAS